METLKYEISFCVFELERKLTLVVLLHSRRGAVAHWLRIELRW